MEASLSVSQIIPTSSRKNTSKSLKASKTNFRNQILMPTIYDIDNIKIVIDHNYPVKPKNKVFQAKKQRVQKKVEQIVSKKYAKVPKVQPMLSQMPSRPKTAPKRIQISNNSDIENKKKLQSEDFCLKYDERINQIGITLQEGTEIAKERYEEVYTKLKKVGFNKRENQLEDEVNFYLTSISPTKKGRKIALKQPNMKDVKGYLHELQKKSRRSQSLLPNKSQIYKKSVNTKQNLLKRNKSLISNRLTRYSVDGTNIHKSSANSKYKQKCGDILQMIEDKCSEYRRGEDYQKSTLKKMRTLWNTKMNKQFQQQKSRQIYDLLPQTLQALQRQRKKQDAIRQIDRQLMK